MPENEEDSSRTEINQYLISPAAGKRLIAAALVEFPPVRKKLQSGTIVIVAGTTNGYIAEEILKLNRANSGFSMKRFIRGIILPPGFKTSAGGRLPDESAFPGDVVIKDGTWQRGQTIFDVAENLNTGDIIIKGANALDLENKEAAVLIGHPQAGTIGAALRAAAGRRIQLILPVGLEKRVPGSLNDIARRINMPNAHGYRLMPVPGGIVFTEIDAISLLTGASAEIMAAGGVCGAEGSVLLAVSGTEDQLEKAERLIESIKYETPFLL